MADFEYSGPSQEDLERLKEIIKLENGRGLTNQEDIDTANRLRAIYGDLEDAQVAMRRERVQQNALLKEELAEARKTLETYENIGKSWKTKNEVAAQSVEIAQKELQIMRTQGGYNDEEIKKQQELIEQKQKQVELVKRQQQAVGDLTGSFTKLVTQGTDLKEALTVENITKQFADLYHTLSSGTTGIKEFLVGSLKGIVFGMINNIIQLTMEIADTGREFQRATGLSQEFADDLTDTYQVVRQQGVSMKELSAAGQTLAATYTDFTKTDKGAREGLLETATVLEKMGVATGDFSQGIQAMTKGMGHTAESAEHAQQSLTMFAKDIGVAPGKMAADFSAAASELSALGDNGVKAFKDLARTSKITGIEVGRLLDITSKFDTFEGAATQAGQLNAALGGNFVNAMDLMMTTDPNERFRMLRDSIKDAGLAFDDMSYYQKKMYAESMGMKDVGELAMALSGDLETVNKESERTEEDWIKLKTQQQNMLSLQEQFNALIASFVPIIKPAVHLLNEFMGALVSKENLGGAQKFSKYLGDFIVSFAKWLMKGVDLVKRFWNEMRETEIFKELLVEIGKAWEKIKTLVKELLPSMDKLSESGKQWLGDIVERLKAIDWEKVIPAAIELFKVWAKAKMGESGIGKEISYWVSWVETASSALTTMEKISGVWQTMGDITRATGDAIMHPVDSFGKLKDKIFEKNSPALWEALKGFGPDVTKIGKAFSVLTSPLKTVAAIFKDMGAMINNIMEAITAIPAMVMAINELDVTKAAAMGAMMVAGGTATAVAAGGGGAPAAAPAAGAPATFVIPVQIDGNEIGKVAYEYYGNKIKQINGLG